MGLAYWDLNILSDSGPNKLELTWNWTLIGPRVRCQARYVRDSLANREFEKWYSEYFENCLNEMDGIALYFYKWKKIKKRVK